MSQDKQAMDQVRAWESLGEVEDHPTVRRWLEELERSKNLSGAGLVPISRTPPAPALVHRRVFWAAAASVIIAIGTAATLAYLHFGPHHFETGIGEQRDVLLSDGSRVTLNTATALTVRYSEGSRRIELRQGEALFSVKHDAARPFEVTAGQTVTRAIGTQFNVDLRQSKVIVSVLEGAVRVSAPQQPENKTAGGGETSSDALVPVAALAKGRSLEFSSKERQVHETKADLKRIDAWRTRRLEFSDTPLAEAVEEFNRYSTTRVTIGSPGLEAVRVSGVFSIGDAEGFLYSLHEALGVQTHESAGEVILMRPAR